MSSARPPLRLVRHRERPAAGADLGPAFELAAIGLGLTLAMSLMGRIPDSFRGLGTFQALYVVAFAFFALALLRLSRYAAVPHAGLLVLAVALAARAALLPLPPSLSDDIYRYVWEGRVIVHGGDPYRQPPDDPALAPLRDRTIYPAINHKSLSTIYPPLAEAGFALVARLSPTVGAFKLWVLLHDLALVALLLAWAARRGTGAAAVIAYAWNPLVLVEYAGNGHNDPTALAWLALAFLLSETRPVLAALALTAAALVKLAPLAALPFLLRRWPWRARWLSVGLLAIGLSWFWSLTRATYSGLIVYWGTWRNNELLFHYLERLTGRFDTARTLSLALVAGMVVLAWWRRWPPVRATRDTLGAALVASPVMHPWYLGWVLAFEPLGPSAPWLLLSCTAILNYGVFARPAEGHGFHLSLGWRWVEYGAPLLLALGLVARARLTRSTSARA